MRILLILLIATTFFQLEAQPTSHYTRPHGVDHEPDPSDPWIEARLNTAVQARYMRPSEREMVYEINRLRSDPRRYTQYLQPYLEEAQSNLEKNGSGTMRYSITTYYTQDADGNEVTRKDTTWHDLYLEEIQAVQSLIDTLNKMEPLRILKPNPAIYQAAKKHARDQEAHNWKLGHKGSDGSWPWNRITKFAPNMANGNENLAGKGAGSQAEEVPPREIVIILLIDAGIPGYGHRWNTLNPKWTHIAPYYGGWANSMHQWIQEYGQINN